MTEMCFLLCRPWVGVVSTSLWIAHHQTEMNEFAGDNSIMYCNGFASATFERLDDKYIRCRHGHIIVLSSRFSIERNGANDLLITRSTLTHSDEPFSHCYRVFASCVLCIEASPQRAKRTQRWYVKKTTKVHLRRLGAETYVDKYLHAMAAYIVRIPRQRRISSRRTQSWIVYSGPQSKFIATIQVSATAELNQPIMCVCDVCTVARLELNGVNCFVTFQRFLVIAYGYAST